MRDDKRAALSDDQKIAWLRLRLPTLSKVVAIIVEARSRLLQTRAADLEARLARQGTLLRGTSEPRAGIARICSQGCAGLSSELAGLRETGRGETLACSGGAVMMEARKQGGGHELAVGRLYP